MQKIKTIAQPISEILKICYSDTLWACPSTSENDNTCATLIDPYLPAKNQNNNSNHC